MGIMGNWLNMYFPKTKPSEELAIMRESDSLNCFPATETVAKLK